MSAWSKEFLNWIRPLPVSSDISDIALAPIYEVPMAYKIAGTDDTYYLLSNRQQEGYDHLLPNHGLLLETVNTSQIESTLSTNLVNSTYDNLGVKVFEADGATWLTDFIEPPGSSRRYSSGDLLPAAVTQINLDANSTPPSPGAFAICAIHEIDHVIHAQLLLSTLTCPAVSSSAPSLAPPLRGPAVADGAGEQQPLNSQAAKHSQTDVPVSINDILAHPERFNGRSVIVEGQLENTGPNYFTRLSLQLSDATGRTLPAALNITTEVVPRPASKPNGSHALTLSGLLNKSVTVTGTIEAKDITGEGKTLILHIANVQSTH